MFFNVWSVLDCKTVGFFSKSVKRAVRVLRAQSKRASQARRASEAREKKTSVSPQSRPPFSASFQIFCLTARAYLNTQKYGLFCSLGQSTCCRARGAVFKVRGSIHLFWSVVREGGGGGVVGFKNGLPFADSICFNNSYNSSIIFLNSLSNE